MDTGQPSVPESRPQPHSIFRQSKAAYFLCSFALAQVMLWVPYLTMTLALLVGSVAWTRSISSGEQSFAEGTATLGSRFMWFLNSVPGRGQMFLNALFFAFVIASTFFRCPKRYRIGSIVFVGLLAPLVSVATLQHEQAAFNEQVSPLITELSTGGYFVNFNPTTDDIAGVMSQIVPDDKLLALINHKESIRRKEVVMYQQGFLNPNDPRSHIQAHVNYQLKQGTINLYFYIRHPGDTGPVLRMTDPDEKVIERVDKRDGRELLVRRSANWISGAVYTPRVHVSLGYSDLPEHARVDEDKLWMELQEISKNILK